MHKLFFYRSLATFARVNRDGSTTSIEIRPSYPHKPKAVENLMKGLPELLNPTANSSGDGQSSRTGTWQIDDSGDTIHRHVSLNNEKAISSILEQIKTASSELNHDPHTHVDGTHLTISCTTHVPPGLSMKDVKLARKIDEILRSVSSGESVMDSEVSREQRNAAEKQNIEAIRKAKEDCSCG